MSSRQASGDAWGRRHASGGFCDYGGRAEIIANNAPPIIHRYAEQLKDVFFDDAAPPFGSSWSIAPPIWQEVNALTCVDGSVRPAPGSQLSDGRTYGGGLFRQSTCPMATST